MFKNTKQLGGGDAPTSSMSSAAAGGGGGAKGDSSLEKLRGEREALKKNLMTLDEKINSLQEPVRLIRKKRASTKRLLTREKNKGARGDQEKISEMSKLITSMTQKAAPGEIKLERSSAKRKATLEEFKKLDKTIKDQEQRVHLDGVDEREYPAYAQALANTLQSELKLADDGILTHSKAALTDVWYSEVPSRSEVGGFSCGDRVKESLGVDSSVDFSSDVPLGFGSENPEEKIDKKLFQWFFCMVHCGFEPRSATDMDHADPYEHVRENQQILLGFLNENKDFARELIKKDGMSEYFREYDGKIQASKLFFAKGYNAIDNLWLLCHVCNLNKGASDPKKWFGNKPAFGKAFLTALLAAGSLHSGVLIARVYHASEDTLCLKTGDGKGIKLHAGEAKELGVFVKEWFKLNRKKLYEVAQAFKGGYIEFFRRGLAAVLASKDPQQAKVVSRRLQNGIALLSPSFQGAVSAAGTGGSDSGSDNLPSKRFMKRGGMSVHAKMLDLIASCSEIKKTTHFLEGIFGSTLNVWSRMDEYLDSPGELTVSSRDFYDLRMNILSVTHEVLSSDGEFSEEVDLDSVVSQVKSVISQFISQHRAEHLGSRGSSSPRSDSSSGDRAFFDGMETVIFQEKHVLDGEYEEGAEQADTSESASSRDEASHRKRSKVKPSVFNIQHGSGVSRSADRYSELAEQVKSVAERIQSLSVQASGEVKAGLEREVLALYKSLGDSSAYAANTQASADGNDSEKPGDDYESGVF